MKKMSKISVYFSKNVPHSLKSGIGFERSRGEETVRRWEWETILAPQKDLAEVTAEPMSKKVERERPVCTIISSRKENKSN